MELIEIRDLDGPNLFGLCPLIKLEVQADRDELASLEALASEIAAIHRELYLDAPMPGRQRLDLKDHFAITFPWTHATCARGIGRLAFARVRQEPSEISIERLQAAYARDELQGNHPLWVRDKDRRIPVVGITGTNGKTTTTRMLVHIARLAKQMVGWTSSTGVFIDGHQVLEGDYTGPSGARRVLEEPDLDLAVLETARGGMLLRGIAYESNDVGVFLNVSADHLSSHGVETIETLAEVKSLVVRLTRPGGLAVLNADDPLVASYQDRVRAEVLFTSRQPDNSLVARHRQHGGRALICDGKRIMLYIGLEERCEIAQIDAIPACFGGAATFMIDNAMAAAGAAIGIGISLDSIRHGLQTFQSDTASNPGRLNAFRLDDRIVIVDYAHNAEGLAGLIDFARRLAGEAGSIHVVVGTAGDRRDGDFKELGRIAAEQADYVYLKDTLAYLRGRRRGEMLQLMRKGVVATGLTTRLRGEFESELEAVTAALEVSNSDDIIVVMSQSDAAVIVEELRVRGGVEY